MSATLPKERAVHAGFKVEPESLEMIKNFLFRLKKKGVEESYISEKTKSYWRQESYFACIHVKGSYDGTASTENQVEDWYKKWSTWHTTNYSQAILNNLYVKENENIIAVSITVSGKPFHLILATNGSRSLQSIKGSIMNGTIPKVPLPTDKKITFDIEPYIHRGSVRKMY